MRTTSGKDWIRESKRQAIYHRDKDRCIACGATHSADHRLSLDHVNPNGDNRAANLITMCVGCNRDKSNRPLAEWRPDLQYRVDQQTAIPLDRKEGIRRFKELRPGRYAAEQYRNSKEGRAKAAERKAEREAAVAVFHVPPDHNRPEGGFVL